MRRTGGPAGATSGTGDAVTTETGAQPVASKPIAAHPGRSRRASYVSPRYTSEARIGPVADVHLPSLRDHLVPSAGERHVDLREQRDPVAIDVALAAEADLAPIPAAAENGAGGVRPLLQQRRDVVGLVLQVLVVAGPARREDLIADARPLRWSSYRPWLVTYARARDDVAVDRELAPQHGRWQWRRRIGLVRRLRSTARSSRTASAGPSPTMRPHSTQRQRLCRPRRGLARSSGATTGAPARRRRRRWTGRRPRVPSPRAHRPVALQIPFGLPPRGSRTPTASRRGDPPESARRGAAP